MGTAGLRMVDDQLFGGLNNRLIDRAQDWFHMMNGLGPVTAIGKQFAGGSGAHMMIEIAERMARGTEDAADRMFMARLGLSAEDAEVIARAPWQRDERTGFILPNVDDWAGGYTVPETLRGRVNVVEVLKDGSPPGLTREDGRYVPAYYNRESNTIYFDRDYIEGEMFAQRAWMHPKIEGVDALLEDAFATPREWSNFVMLHEIMHTRHSADDLNFARMVQPDEPDVVREFAMFGIDPQVLRQWGFKENTRIFERLSGPDLTPTERLAALRKWQSQYGWRTPERNQLIDGWVEQTGIAEYIERGGGGPQRFVDTPAYENAINRMAWEAHQNSMQFTEEVAERFRVAVNTHVNNIIMTATPADKPIIMDGVLYVRESVAERLGLAVEPNPAHPGYVRIENAFLGLPLQFFSFTMANVNKTMGMFLQNGVRNRALGIASMLFLGYAVANTRTPDWAWEEMSPQDKFMRSFDYSGIAALYSDLFYTSLQQSLAMGGPNFTGGFISPRYPQEPNAVDAVTNVTGAASSWMADMGRSAHMFAQGEFGEGSSTFLRNLPFSNVWFMRDDVNQLGRYLAN